MRGGPPSAVGSGLKRSHQILYSAAVRVMRGEVATHLLDDLPILPRLIERVEQFAADPVVQSQFAPRWPVDQLQVIRIEHNQGDGIGTEDLEVLRRQEIE